MTLFGKILLVFNLLASVGFVYFATQDWQGRQNINAAGLRHILLVVGLPLGDAPGDPATLPGDDDAVVPFKVEMAGGFRTDTVSPKVLQTYFANNAAENTPLGNGAVPNQLAEVKRVKAVIDQNLGAAAAAGDKIAILQGMLLTMAETYDERVAIQVLIQAQNADELQRRLDARFAAVLDPPKPAATEATTRVEAADPEDVDRLRSASAAVAASRAVPQDEGERRARIAHLLVHLSPEAAWQKRVAVIVGLSRYVDAVADQSERFADMTQYLEQLIRVDQDVYLTDELTQIRLAIDRTKLAEQQAKLRLKWEEQKRKEDDFVAQRTTELNAIKASLRKIKAEVDELLVRQAGIEKALFEVQREVAVTLDRVYELEARLAARERDLLRLPPKGN